VIYENAEMLRRVLTLGLVAVLMTACAPKPTVAHDDVVSTAAALVGRWRALDSTETRVFLGDGTTWVEGAPPTDAGSTEARGRYRLLSPGQLEIRSDGGTAQTWTATFGLVGAKVLKLRDSAGHTRGYVDASTIPAYAPTTTTGK
jgi:hypothetical protein